jgi:hypothetical protein
MVQIRSGHIPLNVYLCKIGKIDSETCQACQNEEMQLQRRETVSHYLFECTAYNVEREQLAGKISRSHLNLKDIMANTDRMKALATYVNRTGRFKKN